jgi:hypothetical protein
MEMNNMKQFSVESGLSSGLSGTHVTADIKSVLGRVWSATTSSLSKSIKAMQIARMASVLNGMTDAHLARIGITSRSQIWQHAEKLVS